MPDEEMTRPDAEDIAALLGAVRHYAITRNHGLTGGYLECEFWAYSDGSPTGLTLSSWRSEP